jgi:hypothetical protein
LARNHPSKMYRDFHLPGTRARTNGAGFNTSLFLGCKDHLRNLQTRFTKLAGSEIVRLPNRDYRYRLIVPKSVWVTALSEMAGEQEWSNFKNQVARHQGQAGAAYVKALHEVWSVMYRLQPSGHHQKRS